MDQRDHVTSVIAITVCKVIQKSISKIDFLYQTSWLFSLHLFGAENPFYLLFSQ